MPYTEIKIASRYLDRFEQIGCLILFMWLVMRVWPQDFLSTDAYSLVLLFSEGIVVVLILFRRSTNKISVNFRDWVIAVGGTFGPLLVGTGQEPLALNIAVFLLLIGTFIHIASKLSLRRSFGLVAANRGVKVGGMYQLIRHPMYAGYILVHVGYLFLAPSYWNLAVYVVVWYLLIARLFAEEKYLSQDAEYVAFCEQVKYRLIPGIF